MDAPEVVADTTRTNPAYRDQPGLQLSPPRYPESSFSDEYHDYYRPLSAKSTKPIQTSENPYASGPFRPVVVPNKKTTILGLRPPTFILSVLLALVVVIAAIGGGVGASVAVANAKKECASNSGSRTPGSVNGTIATVPTEGLLDFDCPQTAKSRQIVNLGSSPWGFEVKCKSDYIGSNIDIAGMTTYSFTDCITACALFNSFAGNNTCVGVYFNGNLTALLPDHHGNCFLKSYLPTPSLDLGSLSATASLVSSPLS
ncbi:hypothetical protein B0T17DRAFT_510177 [Bombardia bombarda]|uniref:Apple domain-containing protein n=1 Tax=Bombardia bombarda TaxID=252184 RepID=A0AA40BVX3_9PEZI|nr:hypothetical protein B0T17DRAFT_510177 [Bombardia bombarda]